MDSTSIYLTKNHRFSQSFDKNKNKSGWLYYGTDISLSFIHAIKQKDIEPAASWELDDYQIFYVQSPFSQELAKLCQQYQIDFAPIKRLPDLNKPGLALFDMDSTAIQIECIDEMAKLAGVGEEISAITERTMQGELDFEQSLRERVGKLQGLNTELLTKITLPLTPGMQKLCHSLKNHGWHVAIASGGFTFFADKLKEQLALCYVEANQLEIKQGYLTGGLLGHIVSAKRKAEVLVELTERLSITHSQTIAVGDGANDLPMMTAANIGIAYQAKPAVIAKADIAIKHNTLAGIYCVLSASLVLSKH